jgi:hypothetical protein
MHCFLAGFSCRGVDAVRRFPYLIVVFGVAILLVLGVAFFSFRPGGGDAGSTPATDVEAAAAITEAPPVSLSTMAEAIPIVTETPRLVSTAPAAESGGEPPAAALPTVAEEPPPTPLPTLPEAVIVVTETPRVLSTPTPSDFQTQPTPAALPTLVEVSSMYSTGVPDDTAVELPADSSSIDAEGEAVDLPADTSLIDLPGEATELPIVMVSAVRQEDLGLFPNVQMPGGPVGPNELYVAHGDIYGTGQCYVHVFRPGDQVAGLSAATWRLVRISDGVPDQREELVQRIQTEAASDPPAGGTCPFG